ncbi:hypothetical protein HT031_004650 [Scenedesmus sp. PABB004]|nr:hypothetical protein HT031_004650 [Scenedesmus sp. PABB004]
MAPGSATLWPSQRCLVLACAGSSRRGGGGGGVDFSAIAAAPRAAAVAAALRRARHGRAPAAAQLAALQRLAQLGAAAPPREAAQRRALAAELLGELAQRTARGGLPVGSLCRMAFVLPRLQGLANATPLWQAAARQLLCAEEGSSLAAALAAAASPGELLYLLRGLERWACAGEAQAQQLLPAAVGAAARAAPAMTLQELMLATVALARLRWHDVALLGAAAARFAEAAAAQTEPAEAVAASEQQGGLAGVTPQLLANYLWSHATLAHATPELLAGALRLAAQGQGQRALDAAGPAQLALLAWALAVLLACGLSGDGGGDNGGDAHSGCREAPAWAALAPAVAAVCSDAEARAAAAAFGADGSGADALGAAGLVQLHIARLLSAAALRATGQAAPARAPPAAAPAQLVALRGACRAAVGRADRTTSHLQRLVADELAAAGLRPELEAPVSVGSGTDGDTLAVDILCDAPAALAELVRAHGLLAALQRWRRAAPAGGARGGARVRLAVEVDGPSHVAANCRDRALGGTVARDWLLRQQPGLVVASLAWWEWEAAQSGRSQQAEQQQEQHPGAG